MSNLFKSWAIWSHNVTISGLNLESVHLLRTEDNYLVPLNGINDPCTNWFTGNSEQKYSSEAVWKTLLINDAYSIRLSNTNFALYSNTCSAW